MAVRPDGAKKIRHQRKRDERYLVDLTTVIWMPACVPTNCYFTSPHLLNVVALLLVANSAENIFGTLIVCANIALLSLVLSCYSIWACQQSYPCHCQCQWFAKV